MGSPNKYGPDNEDFSLTKHTKCGPDLGTKSTCRLCRAMRTRIVNTTPQTADL